MYFPSYKRQRKTDENEPSKKVRRSEEEGSDEENYSYDDEESKTKSRDDDADSGGSRESDDVNYSVHVTNLNFALTVEEIKDTFSDCGKIVSAEFKDGPKGNCG